MRNYRSTTYSQRFVIHFALQTTAHAECSPRHVAPLYRVDRNPRAVCVVHFTYQGTRQAPFSPVARSLLFGHTRRALLLRVPQLRLAMRNLTAPFVQSCGRAQRKHKRRSLYSRSIQVRRFDTAHTGCMLQFHFQQRYNGKGAKHSASRCNFPCEAISGEARFVREV